MSSLASVLMTACLLCTGSQAVLNQERARVELPYRGGIVVILADRIYRDSADRWVAEGAVLVEFSDTRLKTDFLRYDQTAEVVETDQPIEITRGVQWLKGSGAQFNLGRATGRIYDADGFTDEELFIKAKVLIKTGPDTYVVEDGLLTSCSDIIPKWSVQVSRAKIHLDHRVTVKNPILKARKVPFFYLPYMMFPTGKKERSSGFLIPSTGNSSRKGRSVTQSFYLVLGQSADVTFREDYFSKRGFGHGFTVRARPNAYSHLFLDGYTIDDRLGQGGTSLNGTGETHVGNYRFVADFNLVSNFVFRRVFSESFLAATRPTEASHFFVTNNFGGGSFNLRLAREETVFPTKNAVVRHTPSLSFNLVGQPIPHTPFFFDLRTAAEGISRVDREIETPAITQRLDLRSSLYTSIPIGQGLRITPRISFRETFYGDSLSEDGEGQRVVSSESLNRQFFDLTIDVRGWGLSKVYQREDGSSWKHLIEPELRYRLTDGIGSDFHEVIRFDENDAIADTNEIEYAIVNRFFVQRRTRAGSTAHEWLSIKVGQKYFFDSDFGGALQAGPVNQFFPLYTLTGFPYGALRRNISPLTTAARFNPSRRISFDVRGDYDFAFNTFRDFSLTGFLHRDLLSIGTTYYVTKDLEPGTFENNQIQGQVSYGNINRGLSASAVFSYDARTRALLNIRSRLNYFWDCCGVSVELQRLNLGLREESQLRFSFFLKGLGSFGTIRRPESIF